MAIEGQWCSRADESHSNDGTEEQTETAVADRFLYTLPLSGCGGENRHGARNSGRLECFRAREAARQPRPGQSDRSISLLELPKNMRQDQKPETIPKSPWVPFVAYGLAGTISFSRITRSDHFSADVFFGGTIGYVISRYVVLPGRS
jgi:hypothetical protein